jgi:predicted transcriptional regulator
MLIVRALIPGPCHVAAIARKTRLTPSRVSHHLARMRQTGVVEYSKKGRTVSYQINPRIALPDGLDLGCCRILFRAV